MSHDRALRNIINEHTSSSFIDNMLNNDSIQVHSNYNKVYGQSVVDEEASSLDDFKNKVKIWMKLDNEIKDISTKIKMLDVERKQRKKYQAALTPFILSYMNSNEIEELNSRDGRLQYKTSLVKAPLSTKDIKTKLYEQFDGNKEKLDRIFKEREKVQKVSLRRLLN